MFKTIFRKNLRKKIIVDNCAQINVGLSLGHNFFILVISVMHGQLLWTVWLVSVIWLIWPSPSAGYQLWFIASPADSHRDLYTCLGNKPSITNEEPASIISLSPPLYLPSSQKGCWWMGAVSPGTGQAGICLADALAGIKTSINIGLDIMRE